MRILVLILFLFVFQSAAMAQEGTSISGKVLTENGASPEGGVVTILNTTQGAVYIL